MTAAADLEDQLRALRAGRASRVRVVANGLRVGERDVPLLAGSVHYWRMARASWRRALQATRDLGLRLVDVYVPWSVHELTPREYDFGARDPRRDVAAFLRLAAECDLLAIVRPGPHINAELTGFGIPKRVLWDPECQARSPRDNPVILPSPPLAFPVPSYASERFLEEASHWLGAVARELSALRAPDGPLVLVQVDNEGAYYFRDGVADQDFHVDALALHEQRLAVLYPTFAELRVAYADAALEPGGVRTLLGARIHAVEPAGQVRARLDWAETQEVALNRAFLRFALALHENGLGELPLMHNVPLGEVATPLDPEALHASLELVGLDYYHAATEPQRAYLARRTSELVERCNQSGSPPFACELGAGFPPFYPPLGESDSVFTCLAALAYGLRGFNLYMAVERDRWIGAPIDVHGNPRPLAETYRRIIAAFERVQLPQLRRRTSVLVVVPRAERRLARALHAFGPITLTAFTVAEGGALEATLDAAPGRPDPHRVDTALRALAALLDEQGVPWALGAEDLVVSAEQPLVVVLSCATLDARSAALVEVRRNAGRAVLVDDGADTANLLAAVVAELDALAIEREPPAAPLHVTRLVDEHGNERCLFALNASAAAAQLRLPTSDVTYTDALTEQPLETTGATLELHVPARGVRWLERHPADHGARRD